MRFHILTVLATFAATVVADVSFTAPVAGSSKTAGTAFTITWEDDGDSPTIDQFSTYTLNLMAGGSTGSTCISVYTIKSGAYSGTTGSVSAVVPVNVGATSTDGYFLQMISVGTDGGQDIVYSSRFGMTGMTGTFTAAIASAIKEVTGTDDVPAASHGLTESSDADAGASPWTVAYASQTGLVKYAPPQPIPPTKITAKSPTPLNPSSSFTIATTYLAAASITYTSTATQTFSVSSIENTNAAASRMAHTSSTTGDLKKYLARWVD